MAVLVLLGLSVLSAMEGAQSETANNQADFRKFDEKARAGETLNVVFFGGSLTWGAQATDPQLTSYRAQMARKFDRQYPRARFRYWDGAIGGTGSQLGAFRLDRDVLARKPDLVFLDFTVNDGSPNPDNLASYESLVRRLVQAGIPVVQAIFAGKKDVLPNPLPRPLDEKHKDIARAYHLPVGDAVALMQKRVTEGKADPDQLWPVPEDQTHPGDAGYALYAEAVWDAYQEAVLAGTKEQVPKNMLHADTYMTVNRQHLAPLPSLPWGWKPGQPNRTGVYYDFTPSRWLDDVLIASVSENPVRMPEPILLVIRGANVLLFGEATPRSGKYQVRIDGGESKIYDFGTLAETGNSRYFQMIAQGLDPSREHLIEIVPQLEVGQELRFESICVAGSPATVSLQKKP